jgi:hypothetical protein
MIDKNEAYKTKARWDKKSKDYPCKIDYTKNYKKVLHSYKLFYWQLLGFYNKEELKVLFEDLKLCEYWSTTPQPKDMNPYVFSIASLLYQYKKVMCSTYENIPLFSGNDDTTDKIISWRFRIGK